MSATAHWLSYEKGTTYELEILYRVGQRLEDCEALLSARVELQNEGAAKAIHHKGCRRATSKSGPLLK